MPYQSNDELPPSVQKYLPTHAQDIYREAFNQAYTRYQDTEKKMDKDESLDEVSHRVAWSAVKKKYAKGIDEHWHIKK